MAVQLDSNLHPNTVNIELDMMSDSGLGHESQGDIMTDDAPLGDEIQDVAFAEAPGEEFGVYGDGMVYDEVDGNTNPEVDMEDNIHDTEEMGNMQNETENWVQAEWPAQEQTAEASSRTNERVDPLAVTEESQPTVTSASISNNQDQSSFEANPDDTGLDTTNFENSGALQDRTEATSFGHEEEYEHAEQHTDELNTVTHADSIQEDEDDGTVQHNPSSSHDIPGNPADTGEEYSNEDDPNVTQGEDYDEENQAYEYFAFVHCRGHVSSLFPTTTEEFDSTEKQLLDDPTLVHATLHELIAACKPLLEISSDDALFLSIPALNLLISEDDNHCRNVTLAQILDVYYQLYSNEEVYDPEPPRLHITSQPRFSARLNAIFSAAERGVSMSSYQQPQADEAFEGGEHDGDDTQGEEQVGESEQHQAYDEEYAREEAHAGEQMVESEQHQAYDEEYAGDEAHAEDYDAENQGEDTNENEPPQELTYDGNFEEEVTHMEENMLHGDEQDDEGKAINNVEHSVPKTTGAAGDERPQLEENELTTTPQVKTPATNFDEEDLIDYSDDEELEPSAGTSRSSTIVGARLNSSNNEPTSTDAIGSSNAVVTKGNATSATNEPTTEDNDEEILLDFELEDRAAAKAAASAEAKSTKDAEAADKIQTPRFTASNDTATATATTNDDDWLVLDDDDEPTADATTVPQASPAVGNQQPADQDEIDFDDDDDIELPRNDENAGGHRDSPLGKRSWDDHAGGVVIADDAQDVKRVKSN